MQLDYQQADDQARYKNKITGTTREHPILCLGGLLADVSRHSEELVCEKNQNVVSLLPLQRKWDSERL